MKSFEEHEDDLLRRIGLKLDERLDESELRSLDHDLGTAVNGRELESSLRQMRGDLLAVPLPKHSDALLSRTLTRVAAARAARERDGRILPFLRAFAAVAALVLVANVFYLENKLRADDDVTRNISIEDEIRRAESLDGTQKADGQKADGQKADGLSRFLAWYFLRRDG